MAKKKATQSKKVAKRKPVKAASKARARKAKPSRAAARPAPKAKRAVNAKAEAERRRLINEERALAREAEPDTEESRLSDSPEYIPDAINDPLGAEMGEAAVASATSGDQADETIRDEDVEEDEGGPFVITSAKREFAMGTDASNPEDAEPADFPTANARRK